MQIKSVPQTRAKLSEVFLDERRLTPRLTPRRGFFAPLPTKEHAYGVAFLV